MKNTYRMFFVLMLMVFALVACSSEKANEENVLETIEVDAFSRCPSLETITFPNSIKTIKATAFNNSQLESIYFPEKVEGLNIDTTGFPMRNYLMTVYIIKDSWMDKNQEEWNIDFGSIEYY